MAYKVIAINGSPRIGASNTRRAMDIVSEQLAAQGIQVEHIQIGNMRLWGCQACGGCQKRKDGHCAYDDGLNVILDKIWEADGLLIGSPTYYGGMTAQTKAFIDRCGYVSGANGHLLKGKIGAAVAIHRRAGANTTYAGIQYLFGISEMPIATSSYWNMGVARDLGTMDQDAEGIQIFTTLGQNMAEMIQKLRA
ncbi:flavodoxin family protein [Eubacteriales bacterium OttesenSCG-928-N13]|nr:flavodoxin family protein [Eubacteriales bacterium OttesenSCG-928-N13]